eukprot:293517_1
MMCKNIHYIQSKDKTNWDKLANEMKCLVSKPSYMNVTLNTNQKSLTELLSTKYCVVYSFITIFVLFIISLIANSIGIHGFVLFVMSILLAYILFVLCIQKFYDSKKMKEKSQIAIQQQKEKYLLKELIRKYPFINKRFIEYIYYQQNKNYCQTKDQLEKV